MEFMKQVKDGGSPQSRAIALTVSAIGVVFGDIGTSPLYALRECFAPGKGIAANPENILGIVSLLLWTLTIVVSIEYLTFVLRADNRGEGGILALISLVSANLKKRSGKMVGVLAVLGIIGASLLYSDGILTPSISVLSAIEGLEVISAEFTPYIVPLTIVVLILLFMFQSRGTEKVGKLFGPLIIIWFIVMAVMGVIATIDNPSVLQALNPYYAVRFLIDHIAQSLGVLGSVFLAMTGAEVMYADLGHFGKRPIRRSWFFLVFPALVLNYLGQAAFLLGSPDSVDNLFFRLAPQWMLYPLVTIATIATVIASQAVISGAFSLARQSVQLGFWPRMQIRHTSADTFGQVYVPFINWALMIGSIALVIFFKKSENLANAYGIAISATMLITFFLMIFVATKLWQYKWWVVLPFCIVFFVIDFMFFVANVSKVFSGGMVVVLFAIGLLVLMKTWMDGRATLRKRMEKTSISLEEFVTSLDYGLPTPVKGTAIFLAGNPRGVPLALLHNLKHNKVLHEKTVVLSVQTLDRPRVSDHNRFVVTRFKHGIWQVVLNYGFSEIPDIPQTLMTVFELGFDPMQTTYFLGREVLVVDGQNHSMWLWRKKLFWFLAHNALAATSFFRLPPNRVIEIGAQTEL